MARAKARHHAGVCHSSGRYTKTIIRDVRTGVAFTEARRRKARTYAELTRQGGRAQLVVLAGETRGPWSNETASFLLVLAGARSRSSKHPKECPGSVASQHGVVGDRYILQLCVRA